MFRVEQQLTIRPLFTAAAQETDGKSTSTSSNPGISVHMLNNRFSTRVQVFPFLPTVDFWKRCIQDDHLPGLEPGESLVTFRLLLSCSSAHAATFDVRFDQDWLGESLRHTPLAAE
jgi:hypothetical protein